MFTPMSSSPPAPLLQHYDYASLDRCDCPICEEHRQKELLFKQAEAHVIGHGKSCMCAECREMRLIRRSYHAARTRREVLSEMSFHAGWGHDFGDPQAVMEAVYDLVTSNRFSDGWWSKRAVYFPMDYWFREAAKGSRAAALAVSGVVAALVTGAISLVAAVSGAMQTHAVPVVGPPHEEDIMTTSPVINAAKQEIAQLEAELQKLPLYQRLLALKTFAENYAAQHLPKVEAALKPALNKAKALAKGAVSKAEAVTKEEKAAIVAAAKRHLQGVGTALAKDIASALEADGVKIPSTAPSKAVGAWLKKDPGVAFSRDKGYSLKS